MIDINGFFRCPDIFSLKKDIMFVLVRVYSLHGHFNYDDIKTACDWLVEERKKHGQAAGGARETSRLTRSPALTDEYTASAGKPQHTSKSEPIHLSKLSRR